MRLIACSIVVLTGGLMASLGKLAESFNWGMIVLGIGLVLFVIEWWPMPPEKKRTDKS